MKVFVILVAFSIHSLSVLASQTELNKHALDIKEITSCETKGTGEIRWDFRLKRQTRDSVVMEGNISMAVDLDSSVGAMMNVLERGNGGWIDSSLVFTFNDMCNDFGKQFMEPAWTLLWTQAGLQPPIECPIAKGDYFLKDYSAKASAENSTFLNQTPQFTTEQVLYKVLINFIRNSNNDVLGCVAFIVAY